MKILRIFLLILIIIGIFAIITQKFWVPKLVDKILSTENTKNIILPEIQSNITLTNGRQCYTYSHEATPNEPYNVTEFIDMTITGTKVTGTKQGNQKGPDMTNGYTGKITGTLDQNMITDIFSYVVEGSHGQEKEIYKAGKNGLEKIRYPLIEEKGILVPDTTEEFKTLNYARVGCTASN